MINPITEITINHVVVCGVRIIRPSGTSVLQWLEIWEEAHKAIEDYIACLAVG